MNTENRRSPKRRDTTKPVAGACRGCRGQALLTHREPRSRISAQRRCRSSLTEDMRQSATGTGIIATCPKGCNPAL
jgi:hypothetical protein